MIGLEPTWEEHLDNLLAVFGEVRRVLRDDGVCVVNYGDAYARGPGRGGSGSGAKQASNAGSAEVVPMDGPPGTKAKDLMMMPSRFALAMQSDGWTLRSMIPWIKPNPMPESVTDRPTNAVEYFFLFAKSKSVSRVVQFSNLDGERVHFLDDFRPRLGESSGVNSIPSLSHSGLGKICVRLAAAILDCPEFKNDLGLPFLDTKIGQEGDAGAGSNLAGDIPIVHRAAVLASALIMARMTTKEFLCELNGLGVTLTDSDDLLIGGISIPLELLSPVYRNGETSIAIQHAGQVCEVDFVHERIIRRHQVPVKYFWDDVAVRTPLTSNTLREGTGHGRARKNPENGGDAGLSAWHARRKTDKERGHSRRHDGFNDRWDAMPKAEQQAAGANMRNYIFEATVPFRGEIDEISLVQLSASQARELVSQGNAGDGDICRIGSPDCREHEGLPDWVPTGFCDGLPSRLRSRIEGTAGRHAQAPVSAEPSSARTTAHYQPGHQPSEDCSGPEDSGSANPHSSGSHKTAHGQPSSPRAKSSEETPSGTGYIEPERQAHSSTSQSTAASRTSADTSSAGHGSQPAETLSDSAGIPERGDSCRACQCSYYHKVQKKTSHFATFPPSVIEPFILAGTSAKGCCPECGAPWTRATKSIGSRKPKPGELRNERKDGHLRRAGDYNVRTLRWEPSCECNAGKPVPCTVLDPFGGAGTTGLVADRHQRDAVLIEISDEYAELARQRIYGDAPLLTEV